jgi:hypothetical protein
MVRSLAIALQALAALAEKAFFPFQGCDAAALCGN